MEDRVVVHIDFDYFYAQCEEIRNPELRGKPLCVCIFSDRGGDSGAVATANYNARKFGAKSGIPIAFAKKRLENQEAVFLPADFRYYSEISEKAMNIIKENADIFEYVGRDEAYLDLSERTKGDFETAKHIGQQLKNQILRSVRLTCSIGISPNKLVSKIASDFKKPDGLTAVPPSNVEQFLETLKIRDIPGIGKKTEQSLTKLNLHTIDDLRKLDIFELQRKFGRKIGTYIYNSAKGVNDDPVKEREPSIQYSKIVTLKENSKEYSFLSSTLKEICKELHNIVLKNNRLFKTVSIQFVQEDLSNKTKSKTLKNPTVNIDELQKTADKLLQELLRDQELLVRRLGVKVSDLTEMSGQSTITNYF
ncbi:MAG: DNA polymerase IV [Nitrosopumilaceae archaeon]|nr:DNA polymerase IV [Nitrosopumilaceae archaeon]NIT99760.1 DNA polymerase IV [Nitrosopumilaceae archaeon]NIU88622.1 DNA polymerase IV [Nitrosopumilaceae archaeon]NIV64896.1 DNA polymerase IV [Nitrosopumilaceae archaeon]NIX60363.1 DNA polymerase IV [Nitrosopumilaceae archaeon]